MAHPRAQPERCVVRAAFSLSDQGGPYVTTPALRATGQIAYRLFMIASLNASARFIGAASALCALPFALHGSLVENFSDLSLAPDSHWNGSDGAGNFQSGSAVYYNDYDSQYGSWSGFAYSNSTNGSLQGVSAQYTAVTLGGMSVSGTTVPGDTYVVANYNSYADSAEAPSLLMQLALSAEQSLGGLYLTNSLYAYDSMMNGDDWAKKFGGLSGNDKDWFKLTITGRDQSLNATGVVEFYLADYRFEDNADNYILDDWAFVDLSSLGIDTEYLSFAMSSSDNGANGMNTPAYFVLGGLAIVPEPSVSALMLSSLALAFILLRRRARRS